MYNRDQSPSNMLSLLLDGTLRAAELACVKIRTRMHMHFCRRCVSTSPVEEDERHSLTHPQHSNVHSTATLLTSYATTSSNSQLIPAVHHGLCVCKPLQLQRPQTKGALMPKSFRFTTAGKFRSLRPCECSRQS